MPDPASVARGVYAGDDFVTAAGFELRAGSPLPTAGAGLIAMPVITYLEAIREALFEEMARDERVFLIGEDVGAYGGAFKATEGLHRRVRRERVIDTPISESRSSARRSARRYMGMRPVAEMQFIDFITCASTCSQLRRDEPLPHRRRRARSSCAARAAAASRGGPFHSLNPEALFMNRPG